MADNPVNGEYRIIENGEVFAFAIVTAVDVSKSAIHYLECAKEHQGKGLEQELLQSIAHDADVKKVNLVIHLRHAETDRAKLMHAFLEAQGFVATEEIVEMTRLPQV